MLHEAGASRKQEHWWSVCALGAAKFYPSIEWWNIYFILNPSTWDDMRLRSFTITLPVLTFTTDLHFGPISRKVCIEEYFCQVRTEGWNLFGRFAIFFGVEVSFQAAPVLPAVNSCLLEKSSCSLGLANVVWSIVLHAGKVQPTNLEFILFSSVSFNTLNCFLQRTQTTISSAWQTNRSTKKIYIIWLSLLFISIFLGHLPANKW